MQESLARLASAYAIPFSLVLLAPPASLAQDSFGGILVRGIEVVRDADGSGIVPVGSQPTFLSAQNLCERFLKDRAGHAAKARDVFREEAKKKLPSGWGTHGDTSVELSSNCTARAEILTAAGGNITMKIRLNGNLLKVRLTTPGMLPGDVDPKFTMRFDVEAHFVISVPRNAPLQLSVADSYMETMNTSRISGENTEGAAALAAATAMKVLVGPDFLSDLRKNRVFRPDVELPLKEMNTFLSRFPDSRPDHSYNRTSETLVLHLTKRVAGAKVVDDRCISGFVWRNVTPKDHVCVTPAVRAQVREDDTRAAERRTGPPQRLPACPRAGSCYRFDIPCKSGYVWREAVPEDYVCVTPATRAQAQDDNKNAARRRMDWETVVR